MVCTVMLSSQSSTCTISHSVNLEDGDILYDLILLITQL
jgi:hypothetical protein